MSISTTAKLDPLDERYAGRQTFTMLIELDPWKGSRYLYEGAPVCLNRVNYWKEQGGDRRFQQVGCAVTFRGR